MRKTQWTIQGVVRALATGAMIVGIGDAQAAPAALAGMWGGDRAVLTLSDQGGRLEFDCGYATLTGPVTPDGKGAFKAVGLYFPQQAGPTEADAPPVQVAARFKGNIAGSGLRLTFQQAGAEQIFEMVAGKRQKLVRCL